MQVNKNIVRQEPTPELLALIEKVNTEANAQIIYIPDAEKYGIEEKWENADEENEQGDCEDIAIAKFKRLVAAGFPPASLDFVMCNDETSTYHCVLVARFTDIDRILDSREFSVWNWGTTEPPMSQYHLIETTVGGSFKNWVLL